MAPRDCSLDDHAQARLPGYSSAVTSEPERSLDELLIDHLPRLRAFVRLRTNRAIRARESHSDLVQSVCREVLEGSERFRFDGEVAFRKWLYTTALRKIVERDRSMKTLKRDVGREVAAAARGNDDDDDDQDLLAAYHTVSTPSLAARQREQVALLEEAFDDLTDEHREVITLARIVGLSHAEIAAHLGKSEEACRQLLRRAMIRLEMALEKRGLGE